MVNKNSFRERLLSMSQSMLNKIHLVGGAPAEKENQILISQFFEAWLFLASDVTYQFDTPQQARIARLTNFAVGLQRSDLVDVLNICMDAAELLINDSVTDYGTFKESIIRQHPGQESLLCRLLAPVMPLLVSLFECPDVKADTLKWVLSFFRFGKKLNLKAIGLEDQALAAYVSTESHLEAVCLDSIPELVNGMNKIMQVWLRDFNCKRLVPRHGSGSVAEGKLSIYDKYLELGIDLKLKIVLGQCWRDYYPSDPRDGIVRVSRTIFVPKTYSKLRTISMEPVTLQYFQQGVMRSIYDFIEEHPYLHGRINLRDQTQNRDMAKEGSLNNSYSTIDLSAASDCVSWSLVKRVFRRTPILKWLYATRSQETKLPDNRVIRLKKFAPMGSALCFPIECLIFAAVIEYVSQEWCKRTGMTRSRYSVYGDDMIVDTAITNDVILALESLGFIVNHSKSFVDGKFRESCGGDYYEGIDVSSVYYRVDSYSKRKLSPEVYAALCSFANLANDKGFHELRQYIVKLILPMVPYFTDTTEQSPMLYSKFPTNHHARKKWNEDFQCWLGKFVTVLSKPVDRKVVNGVPEDDIAYFFRLTQMATSGHVRRYDEEVVDICLHGSCTRLGYVLRPVEPIGNELNRRMTE